MRPTSDIEVYCEQCSKEMGWPWGGPSYPTIVAVCDSCGARFTDCVESEASQRRNGTWTGGNEMVCTVPYLGAYPHLRLARKHHLRYEIVLALAELHCGTSIDDPRIAEQINVFNNWQFHNHDASCELLTDVRIAAIHFQEQKDGLRGMDGAVL